MVSSIECVAILAVVDVHIVCVLFEDEIDSYMYQTVGHHAIDLYAEAFGLPLYRRTIFGLSLEIGKDYTENADDEVEDLFLLLKQIKLSALDKLCSVVHSIFGDSKAGHGCLDHQLKL